MKFSEITNRTCLYLLGGIAGMEALYSILFRQEMENCFLSSIIENGFVAKNS